MVRISTVAVAVLFVAARVGAAPPGARARTIAGAKLRFATAAEGARLLGARDRFVAALSPFDRAARAKTDQPVEEAPFLERAAAQARDWTPDEKARLARLFAELDGKLVAWQLPLPADVVLLKTTGLEEGNAAYCRGNAIVIPEGELADPDSELSSLLTHELFHIMSRNAPKLRDSLYEILGFVPCAEVPFPTELAARKITNPDAPLNDHELELRPGVHVVPILYASKEHYDPIKGGEFFNYLTFRLLVITRAGDAWKPKIVDGKAQLIDPTSDADFQTKMGQNTKYLIHPEEILADNFVLLVSGKRDVPTPKILGELERRLARPK
jgi:hypothetical protein